eukprot:6212022-Pleurochrysis_carterae.AAC.4
MAASAARGVASVERLHVSRAFSAACTPALYFERQTAHSKPSTKPLALLEHLVSTLHRHSRRFAQPLQVRTNVAALTSTTELLSVCVPRIASGVATDACCVEPSTAARLCAAAHRASANCCAPARRGASLRRSSCSPASSTLRI